MRAATARAQKSTDQLGNYAFYFNDIKHSGIYRITINPQHKTSPANVTIYFYSQSLASQFEQYLKKSSDDYMIASADDFHSISERTSDPYQHNPIPCTHIVSKIEKRPFNPTQLINILALAVQGDVATQKKRERVKETYKAIEKHAKSHDGEKDLNRKFLKASTIEVLTKSITKEDHSDFDTQLQRLQDDYKKFLSGGIKPEIIAKREVENNALPQNALFRYYQKRLAEPKHVFGTSKGNKLSATREAIRHVRALAMNDKHNLYKPLRQLKAISKDNQPATKKGRLKEAIDEVRHFKMT